MFEKMMILGNPWTIWMLTCTKFYNAIQYLLYWDLRCYYNSNNNFLNGVNLWSFKNTFPDIIPFIYNICEAFPDSPGLCSPPFWKHFEDTSITEFIRVYFDNLLNVCHYVQKHLHITNSWVVPGTYLIYVYW